MTVSPKRPDEGKKTQFREGNPDSAMPGGHTNALPPTLFQLPNLRADHGPDLSKTEISDLSSTREGQKFVHQVAEMPFVSVGTEKTQAVKTSKIQQNANSPQTGNRSDDEPRHPTPPAVVDGPETPAMIHSSGVKRQSTSRSAAKNRSLESQESTPLAPIDRPAGRSWMDSMGSHGIVVTLLLVVVAAALYTGRVGKDDSDNASLAEGRDWLEYSTDEEIKLPETIVAEGSSGVPIEEPDRILQEASQPMLQSGLVSASSVASGNSELENDSLTSSALLRQPVESNDYRDLQSTFAENSERNASDSFTQPYSSINAPVSPAATRRDQPQLPANQPLQTGQPAAYGISLPPSQTPTYQRTATPSGISDWSRYFPRVPSGNTVNPTSSSPSN